MLLCLCQGVDYIYAFTCMCTYGQGGVNVDACHHFLTGESCATLHTHSLILVTGEGVSTYRYNSASFLLNVLVRGRSADFIRGCSWMDVGEGWQEGDGVEEIRLDNNLFRCLVALFFASLMEL